MNNSIELSDIELEAVLGGVLDGTSQGNASNAQNGALVTNTTLQAGVVALGNNVGNVGVGQNNSVDQNNIYNKIFSL